MNLIALSALVLSIAQPVESDVGAALRYDAEREVVIAFKPAVVIEVDTFDFESAKKFAEQMAYAQTTGQSVIPVVISSPGGVVLAALRMVDTIQNSKVPVVTIAEGMAFSAGSILFSAGKERYMGQNATIMIHTLHGGTEGKVKDMEADVQESHRMSSILYSMLDKNTGHKPGFFEMMVKNRNDADWYFGAQEALKLNIATKIGIPVFKTIVKAEYSLGLKE